MKKFLTLCIPLMGAFSLQAITINTIKNNSPEMIAVVDLGRGKSAELFRKNTFRPISEEELDAGKSFIGIKFPYRFRVAPGREYHNIDTYGKAEIETSAGKFSLEDKDIASLIIAADGSVTADGVILHQS